MLDREGLARALADFDGPYEGNEEWFGQYADEMYGWLAEHVRLAQEQAWNEGWHRCAGWWEIHHHQSVRAQLNPYTQGDKQA